MMKWKRAMPTRAAWHKKPRGHGALEPHHPALAQCSRAFAYPTELDGKAGAAAAGGGGLRVVHPERGADQVVDEVDLGPRHVVERDRKSTRLNSSHLGISYAVF